MTPSLVTHSSLSPAQIWAMRYPDFVALIDQENTPPGGDDTLDWWCAAGAIDSSSHVLDLACSTGFSSRGLVQRAGCRAVGMDLSEAAVLGAKARATSAGLGHLLAYGVGNAQQQPFVDGIFSHIVAGCCFGFFADKAAALRECQRVLQPAGRLCVSTFAYVRTPPQSVLQNVATCVGYVPDEQRDERYWRKLFGSRFELEAESRLELPVYSQEQVCEAATSYLSRVVRRFDALSDGAMDAVVKRLARDRLVFNEHRKYQSCTRFVWKLPQYV